MKKVLALIVAATMGLSSVAFAADTAAKVAPMTEQAVPAKATHATHHKVTKKAPAQKAQAAKKHAKKAPAQKAQSAKKHVKKDTAKKPAVVPAA